MRPQNMVNPKYIKIIENFSKNKILLFNKKMCIFYKNIKLMLI